MASRPFSSAVQLLAAPRTLTAFIFGGVALGVLGNAVYQLLTNWLTTSNSAVIRIIIGSLAMLVVALLLFNYFANRSRLKLSTEKRQPYPRKGLICLVSNEPTLRRALEWHDERLQWCWLVCSEQTWPLAAQVKAELVEKGKTVELVRIKDVLDAVECRKEISAVYDSLPQGCPESDVILDFTGMTAIASVGAVLACVDRGRAVQYTPGVYNIELKAVEPRDPVEVTLDWKVQDASGSVETQADGARPASGG